MINAGPIKSKYFTYARTLSIRLKNDREVTINTPINTRAPPRPIEKTKIIIIPYPIFPIDIPPKRTVNAAGQGINPPKKASQNAWDVVF